jgi:hypothetical protein
MNPTPQTPREIAEAMLLFGDLLATGHSIEESATFITAIARGDVNDTDDTEETGVAASGWDGEALLW